MDLFYDRLSQWRRQHPPNTQQGEPKWALKHPWSMFGNDLCGIILKTIIEHSPLDTFIALLSAFPGLLRYVSIISDGQSYFAPNVKAISIWKMDSHMEYDEKPLILFILRLLGHGLHREWDVFQLIQRHSYYFTPGSFIAVEAPNAQCFQLDTLKYFANVRKAIMLPPVVHYDQSLYRNYQCLTDLGNDRDCPELFQERSLVPRPNGRWGFERLKGNNAWTGMIRSLDIQDIINTSQIDGIELVRELTVRFTRHCTQSQCYPLRVINKTDVHRLCVTFRGSDVPLISRFANLYRDLPTFSHPISPKTSITLVNLDWTVLSFYGTGCCSKERHRAAEEPESRRIADGDHSICDIMYDDLFYIGVPIETVLWTKFFATKSLVWKRLTRTNPNGNGANALLWNPAQDHEAYHIYDERVQREIHNRHSRVQGIAEIDAVHMETLKIWSHLNNEDTLPLLFKAPRLHTLVLVALKDSVISWNINNLIKDHKRCRRLMVKSVLIGALGRIVHLMDPMLKWDHYSCLAPTVVNLTLVGYTLDKVCGDNNLNGPFEQLESLSMDVTHLPRIREKNGNERLYISISSWDFPKLKKLVLSSGYDGSISFPVPVTKCRTEVRVPPTCITVEASTALASYPVVVNGKLMKVGGDHSVRDGRWRVEWVRLGEEFSYKQTARSPIDQDIFDMNQ